MYLQNVFTNHMYLIDMQKQDLALNNLQWLMCHTTKQNESNTKRRLTLSAWKS